MFTFFNQLFNPKIKIMDKITFMITLYAFYNSFTSPKDKARAEEIKAAIDSEALKIVPSSLKSTPAPAPAAAEKHENKPNLVDPKTPGAPKQNQPAPATKPVVNVPPAKVPETKAPEVVKPAEVAKPAEEPAADESLIEIYPFHACSVNNGKHDKRINITAPRKFKVFTTEEAAIAANNAYPTKDEFDLVMSEAWDMATAGKTNKEIVAMLRVEIGEFYPELKADSDWYGKLVNPLVATLNLIRTAFGYKATDTKVQVTFPNETGLTLTRDKDLHVTEAPKPAEVEKPVEKKPLETKQTGKVAEKPQDEEAQEAAAEETAEETTEEVAKEAVETAKPAPATEERDGSKPPKVNKFAEFNALETLIFEKYREGATLAASIKDENGRKAVQAEKRDESRMLIASAFEDEAWTEKVDGKWNPLLLSYHNDIVSQISSNRANWPK